LCNRYFDVKNRPVARDCAFGGAQNRQFHALDVDLDDRDTAPRLRVILKIVEATGIAAPSASGMK
jgi:hypothetical protein